MASNKHRRLIRFWPLRDQSPKFRGLYNLRRLGLPVGTIGCLLRIHNDLKAEGYEIAPNTPASLEMARRFWCA